jgi:effector-binding domain-containing protein
MKKTQLNEQFQRMQKLAGIIQESTNENTNEFKIVKFPSSLEEYLSELHDMNASEDIEEGESYGGVFEKDEYGNKDEYEDAALFHKSYDFIKKNGGKVTMEGNPDIHFTSLPNGDIEFKAIMSGGYQWGSW